MQQIPLYGNLRTLPFSKLDELRRIDELNELAVERKTVILNSLPGIRALEALSQFMKEVGDPQNSIVKYWPKLEPAYMMSVETLEYGPEMALSESDAKIMAIEGLITYLRKNFEETYGELLYRPSNNNNTTHRPIDFKTFSQNFKLSEGVFECIAERLHNDYPSHMLRFLPILKQANAIEEKIAQLRNEFTNTYLHLIIPVINNITKKDDHFDDLFQSGYLGLCAAVDTFSTYYNISFTKYASSCIRYFVLKQYYEITLPIHLPHGVFHTTKKIDEASEILAMTYPNLKFRDISKGSDIHEIKLSLSYFTKFRHDTISIGRLKTDEISNIYASLESQIDESPSPEDLTLNAYEISFFLKCFEEFKLLSPGNQRYYDILTMRFILGKSDRFIANYYNFSRQRAFQLLHMSLAALRENY
jgi:RNA polymerase sigma factor (sigma-70 family)